jgi:hypothetical protein
MTDEQIFRGEAVYSRLKGVIGVDMTVYCLCAVNNLPYDPDIEAETWRQYCTEIHGGEFSDGITDANQAILAGMPTQDRWETLWGDGYTEADYRQLDDLYRTMTAQLDSTGGIDPQQDDTARTCARMALNRNKLILNFRDKDSISTANTLDKMIRDNLKDANMRKADILPSAQQRPDGFVDALKKKYGLTVDMTKDDVLQAFFSWCHGKHYPETVDAEEHAMMAILKTMQKNDDMPEPQELPKDLDFGPYRAQFEEEPNEAEEEAFEYLGYVRGEYHREDDA